MILKKNLGGKGGTRAPGPRGSATGSMELCAAHGFPFWITGTQVLRTWACLPGLTAFCMIWSLDNQRSVQSLVLSMQVCQ